MRYDFLNVMNSHMRTPNNSRREDGTSGNKKKWIIIILVVVFLIGGCAFAAKTVINKVAPNSNVFGSIIRNIPLVEDKLDGEDDGRVNVMLLGMRGKGVVGGGTLADTIMVLSVGIEKNAEGVKEYKAAMVSIPRDLYVTVPGTTSNTKINAVYHYGEEKGVGEGMEAMKTVLQDITGQPIHYGIEVNFEGFRQIVDALGGVEVDLAQDFIEPVQFHEQKVCDGANGGVFTVKSGNFETKIDDRGKVVAQYPLCYNQTEECGGVFKVPAGVSILDGERALCYVRARATSSDFDRARRQQEVIEQIKKKAFSVGVLTDFTKIQELMNAVSGNVRTDMELWEMQRFFDLYQKMGNDVPVQHKVLENSEEGLLYSHEGDERGYILIPRGDTYDRIREMFATII
jgi:LCP family protein required for cell wall assembly